MVRVIILPLFAGGEEALHQRHMLLPEETNLTIKKRKGKGPIYIQRISIECNKLMGTLVVKKEMKP
jgi:hypothetical protein